MQSSSMPKVFAGGDIVRGGATVILAMGDGRRQLNQWMNGYVEKVRAFSKKSKNNASLTKNAYL